jgi:hypothetical protein
MSPTPTHAYRIATVRSSVTMGGVPSKAGDPSTTKFQVIGAGYCRTGTVSMQLALETLLDGPVMHGGTHVQSREDSETTLASRAAASAWEGAQLT